VAEAGVVALAVSARAASRAEPTPQAEATPLG
jgi:hypothetical protein